MDYTKLAREFLESMKMFHKIRMQKNFAESFQGEFPILHYISGRNGDVLPGEISSEMNISSARVATVLNSMEKKGLITRHIDTSDRRRIIVNITPKGKDCSKKHHCDILQDTAEILKLLGEKDAKEYTRITAKLVELAPIKNKLQ